MPLAPTNTGSHPSASGAAALAQTAGAGAGASTLPPTSSTNGPVGVSQRDGGPTPFDPAAAARSYSGDGAADALLRALSPQATIWEPGKLPPLSTRTIDIQGGPGVGKTEFLIGDPRGIVIKLRDGGSDHVDGAGVRTTMLRRVPGDPRRIIQVETFDQARQATDFALDYARRGGGPEGALTSIAFDPVVVLWQLCALEYTRQYNTENGKSYSKFDHITEYGKWSGVARLLAETFLDPFPPLGWGWRTVTHYQRKLDPDSKRMLWKSDIADTTAGPIAKAADLRLKLVRAGNYPNEVFMCEPQSEDIYMSGNTRVQMGAFQLWNYNSEQTPPGATAWHCLEHAWAQAGELHAAEQAAFHAARAEATP